MIILHILKCGQCDLILWIPSDMFDSNFDIEEIQLCPNCKTEELNFDGIMQVDKYTQIERIKEINLIYRRNEIIREIQVNNSSEF